MTPREIHISSGSTPHRLPRFVMPAALAFVLAACATTAIDDTDSLSRSGRHVEALLSAEQAARRHPGDERVRALLLRTRDRAAVQQLATAELALAQGRLEEASLALARAQAIDPERPGTAALAAQIEGAREARRRAAASSTVAPALAPVSAAPPALGAAFQRPVSLEFREAPLRQVFEALARSSGVNFVFDKDVRGDTRITVFLRAVTLDEAMRVILATQQLDRKLLNEHTVLVYPNTPVKQREHQELVTRSLYLANADVKQAVNMVRTLAKTRDLHVDERLNAIVVRDTPEVVRQVEQLLATIDLAEPEVMLAVEVMEVATDRLDELGVSWPDSIGYGIAGGPATVRIDATGFRGLVANPALAATLRGNAGTTNLLANPTIRARNREKAKVQIGEKLPVFTTTAAANVGVSTSVSYLDVGLKLDVEPSVQLDGDVIIKVALEVSNLLREVSGPQGSLAYQVGTRMTTTSLRLRDGHTQVLAGLINDEDRRRAAGIPGLSRLPLVGRLFGVQSESRSKSEIVMLITPRIVRQLDAPDAARATLPSGTDALPGATPLRLSDRARAGVGVRRDGGGVAAAADSEPAAVSTAPADGAQGLLLAATSRAQVGRTVSITLRNRSGGSARGELQFDPSQLQLASAGGGSGPGRFAFELAPQGQTAVVMRVLSPAAGQTVSVQVSSDVPVEGVAQIAIDPEVPR